MPREDMGFFCMEGCDMRLSCLCLAFAAGRKLAALPVLCLDRAGALDFLKAFTAEFGRPLAGGRTLDFDPFAVAFEGCSFILL